MNRYADDPGRCQTKYQGSALEINEVQPVYLDYDKTDQLILDIIQDALNHIGQPGMEFERTSISAGPLQSNKPINDFSQSVTHRFPGKTWKSTQTRIDMNDVLIEYFGSIGADPQEPRILSSNTSSAATEVTVFPLPGTPAKIDWRYATQKGNLSTEPHDPDRGFESFELHVVVQYEGPYGNYDDSPRTFIAQ